MKQTSTNFKVKAYNCENKWFMYMLECNKIDHDIFLPAKRSSEILNSVYFGLLLLQLLLTVTLIYTLGYIEYNAKQSTVY